MLLDLKPYAKTFNKQLRVTLTHGFYRWRRYFCYLVGHSRTIRP
jgi:hypothetical protein